MDIYYGDHQGTGTLTATIASLESSADPIDIDGVKVSGGWRFSVPNNLEGVYSVRYKNAEIDNYEIIDTRPVSGSVDLSGVIDRLDAISSDLESTATAQAIAEVVKLLKADEIRDGNAYVKREAGTNNVLVQKTRLVNGDRVELR